MMKMVYLVLICIVMVKATGSFWSYSLPIDLCPQDNLAGCLDYISCYWFIFFRHLHTGIKENDALGTNGSVVGFPPKGGSYSHIQMNGKEVFRFACRVVPQSIETALENAGMSRSSIDWLLLHQV